jgi:hypothetical protein
LTNETGCILNLGGKNVCAGTFTPGKAAALLPAGP